MSHWGIDSTLLLSFIDSPLLRSVNGVDCLFQNLWHWHLFDCLWLPSFRGQDHLDCLFPELKHCRMLNGRTNFTTSCTAATISSMPRGTGISAICFAI